MFRVAIIGAGAIAGVIARALSEIANAQLVAASSRTEAKGRGFATRWGCEWFADSDGMLDAVKPQVAIISTPSGAHLEATLAAVSRGVHVLCEKPIEITVARTQQMIDAADRASVLLG